MKAQTLFVSTVALAALPFVVDSVQASGNAVGSVNASYLNVRTGPSTNDSVIGALPNQSQVTILGESGNWYKIQHNNQEAYVSKDFLIPSSATEPSTNSTSVQSPSTFYVNADSLHFRTGPGTNYSIIDVLSKGDKVEVTGQSGNWYKVHYNGSDGYVYKDYVSTSQNVSTSTTSSASTSQASSIFNNVPALLSYAKSLEGIPYVYGGKTPSGFDCSGFIYYVYSKFGFSFERQSTNSYWSSFTKTNNPLPGDLVYFYGTYDISGASHMGIYLGNGTFISAADNGVSVSSISNPYWSSHFLGYSRPY